MTKPLLVVLGPKGTGKSYLINKIFGTRLVATNAPVHVTQKQVCQEVKDHEQFGGFVDTVGLDADKDNVLSVSELYDKPLVILYLNNDLRIQTSLETIIERFGIDWDKVWIFNSYSFKSIPDGYEPSMQFEDIFLQLRNLPQKTTILRRPVRVEPPPALTQRAPPTQAASTQHVQHNKESKEDRFQTRFQEVKDSSVCSRSGDLRDVPPKTFKKWVSKLSRADVDQYRQIGDSLLSLWLHTMASKKLIDPRLVLEIQTNEFLSNFFVHKVGKDAQRELLRIYEGSVGAEKVGNVVEALLGQSYSVDLFNQLLAFAHQQTSFDS